MGVISECLLLLLLCQAMNLLTAQDTHEAKDQPKAQEGGTGGGGLLFQDDEGILVSKRRHGNILTCFDSEGNRVRNGKKGIIANRLGRFECKCNEERPWPNAEDCKKLPSERDKRNLDTEEELAARQLVGIIEKRGKGRKGSGGGGGGGCKKPAAKRNRSVKQLNQDYVDWHNYYRCLHGVGRVTYSTALEQTAQANVRMNVKKGSMEHSSRSNYGENLWAMWGRGFGINAITGQNPVKSWYDEMTNPGYNFNAPTMFSYGTGHFSQVVWAATKKIGCYTAEHPFQGVTRVFVACEYDPPGNMNLRPKGKNVQNWNKNVPRPL